MKNFISKFIDKDLLSVNNGKQKMSIIALAIPIFFENIGVHLIGLIQTSMSSRFMDGFFIDAFNVPNAAMAPFSTILSLITTGLGILLSIYLGKGKKRDCADIIGTAYIASGLMSIFVYGLGFLFADSYLELLGLTAEKYGPYMSYAKLYFKVKMVALIIYFFTTPVFTTALRCYGYTQYGLISSIISSVVTAVLTYAAYYVIKVPKDSVVWVVCGIGLIANLSSLSFVLTAFFRKGLKIRICINQKWLVAILKVGVPAVVAGLSYTISQTITSSICAHLDKDVLTAKNYINQIVFFVYQIGWSIGQANSLMVGRICGMGDLDRVSRMHRQNIRLVLFFNITISVIFALLARPLFELFFAANGKILHYAEIILWIDVAVEAGRGMNHVGQYGLNATGDVHYTTIVSMTSCWAFSVGLSALFVYVFNWGLYGMWVAFAVDELFRGIAYYIRWRKGGWKTRYKKEEATLEKASADSSDSSSEEAVNSGSSEEENGEKNKAV